MDRRREGTSQRTLGGCLRVSRRGGLMREIDRLLTKQGDHLGYHRGRCGRATTVPRRSSCTRRGAGIEGSRPRAANGARCRHDRPDRDRRPLVHDSVKERFRGGRPVDSRKSATTVHSRYPTFCRSPRASSSSGYRPGNTPKPHSMGQAGRPCSRTCAARPGARLRGAVAACSRRAGGGDAGGAVGRAGG